jgi:hypothetical protein
VSHNPHVGEEGKDGVPRAKAQIEAFFLNGRSLFLGAWREGEKRRHKTQVSA